MTSRVFNIQISSIDDIENYYDQTGSQISSSVDLRITDSPIDDQGSLGSCSANAFVNVYENMLLNSMLLGSGETDFEDLSRLFLYYNSRILEESVESDSGVIELKSTLDAAKEYGICTEELWPYQANTFSTAPSSEAYGDALQRRIPSYEFIANDDAMREVISLYSKPVLVGMYVFDDFMLANKENFTIQLPNDTEFSLGGHAVAVVGYTDNKDFIIKNSFGVDWGNDGYAIMPKEYSERYIFDRWHITIPNKV
jgi:C1A family cysteine protease